MPRQQRLNQHRRPQRRNAGHRDNVGTGMPIFTVADPNAMLDGGDAAPNEEAFHGSPNLAPIWNLPVIYTCETDRWASGQLGGGTLSVEDVSGGSRVGFAVAVEVSVICGGSTTISIEPPAARPVSIASASVRSMVRPYRGWTWITRPTYRHRFKSGIQLRASVDTGKGRGEVQDAGCELRAGFRVGCAQAAIVGLGPGADVPDVRSGNVAGPSSCAGVVCFAEQ